ncbi:PREDICTED: uncharacterized protein LOC106809607 [Priapulus caudatus]|uniref:Uncharacterized protein LOC106809607 n=1 Tax=Priapulus caudatus TaxID=37621 RepID=A0ABM1E7Q7_PRICU|nr:PREDICTED: uncharacterized protein LOC106809607 [Priapulus caudatus]
MGTNLQSSSSIDPQHHWEITDGKPIEEMGPVLLSYLILLGATECLCQTVSHQQRRLSPAPAILYDELAQGLVNSGWRQQQQQQQQPFNMVLPNVLRPSYEGGRRVIADDKTPTNLLTLEWLGVLGTERTQLSPTHHKHDNSQPTWDDTIGNFASKRGGRDSNNDGFQTSLNRQQPHERVSSSVLVPDRTLILQIEDRAPLASDAISKEARRAEVGKQQHQHSPEKVHGRMKPLPNYWKRLIKMWQRKNMLREQRRSEQARNNYWVDNPGLLVSTLHAAATPRKQWWSSSDLLLPTMEEEVAELALEGKKYRLENSILDRRSQISSKKIAPMADADDDLLFKQGFTTGGGQSSHGRTTYRNKNRQVPGHLQSKTKSLRLHSTGRRPHIHTENMRLDERTGTVPQQDDHRPFNYYREMFHNPTFRKYGRYPESMRKYYANSRPNEGIYRPDIDETINIS